MAIDTLDKRFSMLNFGAGSTPILLPSPDGSFDQGNRQHFLDCYGGILFSVDDAVQSSSGVRRLEQHIPYTDLKREGWKRKGVPALSLPVFGKETGKEPNEEPPVEEVPEAPTEQEERTLYPVSPAKYPKPTRPRRVEGSPKPPEPVLVRRVVGGDLMETLLMFGLVDDLETMVLLGMMDEREIMVEA